MTDYKYTLLNLGTTLSNKAHALQGMPYRQHTFRSCLRDFRCTVDLGYKGWQFSLFLKRQCL